MKSEGGEIHKQNTHTHKHTRTHTNTLHLYVLITQKHPQQPSTRLGNLMKLVIYLYLSLVGGLEHDFYFPSIGKFIIPIDFHIFQRVQTTNQICVLSSWFGHRTVINWKQLWLRAWKPCRVCPCACHGFGVGGARATGTKKSQQDAEKLEKSFTIWNGTLILHFHLFFLCGCYGFIVHCCKETWGKQCQAGGINVLTA